MNIIITGATGFIGSAVVERLHQQGHTIRALVRMIGDTLPLTIKQDLVGNLMPNTDYKPFLCDADILIHLAARAHIVKDQVVDPIIPFRETNTYATLNLAMQAANAGISRFVFISSIGVNGNITYDKPFTVSDTPNPAEPYAISKYEAEIGLRKIAAETGMEVVVIRPPLVYGAGAPGNFRKLIKTIGGGIPLPLGKINNQRSYVALPNLIDLIAICISHPAAANQTFLVSDGEDLSTTELLQRLARALGKPARLLSVPQSWVEAGLNLLGKRAITQRLCGNLQIDISKTRDQLGWTPPVSVNEALKQTALAWLKKQRKSS